MAIHKTRARSTTIHLQQHHGPALYIKIKANNRQIHTISQGLLRGGWGGRVTYLQLGFRNGSKTPFQGEARQSLKEGKVRIFVCVCVCVCWTCVCAYVYVYARIGVHEGVLVCVYVLV